MKLSCKQASQLLSQSLDRRLTWQERLALRLHTLICDACKRFGQQLNTLRVALNKVRVNIENDTNISLPSETKARIAKSIESL